MKTALTAALLIMLAFASTVSAKSKKSNSSDDGQYTIVEANAVSLTVAVGTSGDTNKSYKISDATKVTLNGLPAAGRDLMGGMVVTIKIADDQITATVIDAKDPKRGKKK